MEKICVVGLGPMGQRHLMALKRRNSADSVAIVDQNPDVLNRVGDEFEIPSVNRFSTYQEAFVRYQPSIVTIATNGPSHFEIYQEAVHSGVRRILCEKPIAVSVADARAIRALSKQFQVRTLINHSRRWCSDYRKLKETLEGGEIGKVESFIMSMGGGQLGCNGMHLIDLASFLTGANVKSVIGFIHDEDVPNPRGSQFKDPGGYALIHLQDQTRIFFEMAEDLGIPPIMIINGTFGRVILEETKGYYTIESRDDEAKGLPVTRYGTPLSKSVRVDYEDLDIVSLTQQAYDHLISGDYEDSVDQAISALEAVVAVHCSDELNHQQLELPLIEDHMVNRRFTFT